MIDLKLKPPSNEPPEGEFLHSPTEVPIGHTFTHKKSKWVVTWCQPDEPSGWLIMIIPYKSKK